MKLIKLVTRAAPVSYIAAFLILTSCVSSSNSIGTTGNTSYKKNEIIVLVRHGEKPKNGLGQLSITGLKRSLLLPYFFKNHFNRAEYIFAPNPAVKHFENHGDKKWYCYVRPLATIEPTAITLGLPVNTSFGLNDTRQLARELLEPKYNNSMIYIVWEHSRIVDIAQELIKKMHATDIAVPKWHRDNFNMVFVFNINWSNSVGRQLSFKVMSENLDNLADKKVEPAYLH